MEIVVAYVRTRHMCSEDPSTEYFFKEMPSKEYFLKVIEKEYQETTYVKVDGKRIYDAIDRCQPAKREWMSDDIIMWLSEDDLDEIYFKKVTLL